MTRVRPGLGRSTNKICLPTTCCAVALLCATLWASNADAYRWYDNGSGSGCVQCHTGFSGPGPLHNRHNVEFNITNCNVCHPSGGSTKPVLTYWSGVGGGLGCVGCHGQDYGEVSPNSGQAKATGYGLRQLHVTAGEGSCGTGSCHAPGSLGHSNPFPPLFGEDVPPPYFAPAFSSLTDPCSSTQEDTTFDADSLGLDNDGDGAVDWPADADCVVPQTTTTVPFVTTTTLPPLDCGPTPAGGCIAPEKASLLVSEKTVGKEKMKVSLKKLQSVVTQSQFGDPVTGTTGYKVCIYDAANQLSGEYTVERAGEICDGLSCWSAVSDTGYKYSDKNTSADGVLKMNLSGGALGKGKVTVNGKNSTGTLPLGVAAALQNEVSATVQLLSSDASCFGLTLTDVKTADGLTFKAVGP